MLKNPLKQPVTRDTTTHSAGEILRRLAAAGYWISLALAPPLGLLALTRRDEASVRGAWFFAALFLALLATRRWWKTPSADDPTPAMPAAPRDLLDGAQVSRQNRPRILVIDASLAGPGGNSSRLLDALEPRLAAGAAVERAALAGPDAATFASLEERLRSADGFVFATGTHWDSWSSSLQKFLEDATPAEASALWLGKPAAVLVTEHSVGGKGVLSRLQGVLVTLGCALPPLSGLVLSRAAQLARRHAPDAGATEDFWSPADLEVVAHNLIAAAAQTRVAWKSWPVDRKDYRGIWLEPEKD